MRPAGSLHFRQEVALHIWAVQGTLSPLPASLCLARCRCACRLWPRFSCPLDDSQTEYLTVGLRVELSRQLSPNVRACVWARATALFVKRPLHESRASPTQDPSSVLLVPQMPTPQSTAGPPIVLDIDLRSVWRETRIRGPDPNDGNFFPGVTLVDVEEPPPPQAGNVPAPPPS